jgi:hypothetical protein
MGYLALVTWALPNGRWVSSRQATQDQETRHLLRPARGRNSLGHRDVKSGPSTSPIPWLPSPGRLREKQPVQHGLPLAGRGRGRRTKAPGQAVAEFRRPPRPAHDGPQVLRVRDSSMVCTEEAAAAVPGTRPDLASEQDGVDLSVARAPDDAGHVQSGALPRRAPIEFRPQPCPGRSTMPRMRGKLWVGWQP